MATAKKTDPKPEPRAEDPDETAEPEMIQDLHPSLVVPVIDLAKLRALRAPFSPNQIGKLPKQLKKDDRERFSCNGPNSQASADGEFCGGYHARAIHLDYVGHAALTARLLDVDPEWNWEPLAYREDGTPFFDGFGGLWIKLTIGGLTRLGYGDSQGKTGGNAVKEAIGDALRNAGMRFGIALDLWHKGDLYDVADEQGKVAAEHGPAAQAAKKPAARAKKPTEGSKAATGATEGQPAGGANNTPMALAPTEPPEGWQDIVAGISTLQELDAYYRLASEEGWWSPEVTKPVWAARRVELEALAQSAMDTVADAFKQEG